MTKKITYCQLSHNLRKGDVYDSLVDYSKAALEIEAIKKLIFFVKVTDKIENDSFIDNINIIKKNRMKVINMKDVDFDDTKYRNKKKFEAGAESMLKKIMKTIDSELSKKSLVILHTHNMNQGYNPTLSRAIGLMAEQTEKKKKPLLIINHIHAFSEENNVQRIDFVKSCAGKKVDKSYPSTILYPQAKNIMYATTNSFHGRLLKDIGIDNIIVLPNAINVKLYSKKPIYRLNSFNLNKLRIEKIDFKEDIIHKIERFASNKNFIFDKTRKIILAPVSISPKRNIYESILILKILNFLKDEWQLLITNSSMLESEKDYQHQITEYIKKHKLPCIIGFGPDIISSKNDRNVIDGIVFQYIPTDLFGLSQAIISTSVEEETNNIFLEGWLSSTKVFGRRIPNIITDLEKNGMNFKHLYDKILVRTDSIPNFKQKISKAYMEKINSTRKEQKMKAIKEKDIFNKVIKKYKIVKKGKMEYVDFSDLPAKMQLDVLEHGDMEEILMINPNLRKLLAFVDKKNIKVINTNRKVIIKKYSIKSKKEELKKIIVASQKSLRSKKKKQRSKSNDVITNYFIDPKNINIMS